MPKKPIVIKNQTRVIAAVIKPTSTEQRLGTVYGIVECGKQANVFFDGDQIPTSLGRVESIKIDSKHRDPQTIRYEVQTENDGIVEILIPQKGVSIRSIRLRTTNYLRKETRRLMKR